MNAVRELMCKKVDINGIWYHDDNYLYVDGQREGKWHSVLIYNHSVSEVQRGLEGLLDYFEAKERGV